MSQLFSERKYQLGCSHLRYGGEVSGASPFEQEALAAPSREELRALQLTEELLNPLGVA